MRRWRPAGIQAPFRSSAPRWRRGEELNAPPDQRRRRSRRRRALALVGLVAALSALPLRADPFDGRTSQSSLRVRSTPRPASDPLVRRRVYLGRSVKGRRISAVELGDPDNERRTLAVGVVHGNETAGLAVARDLASARPPKE